MSADPVTEPVERRMPFPPERSDEDIRTVALAFLHANLVDMSAVPPRLLPVVFLPLMDAPFAGWSDEERHDVVLFGLLSDESTGNLSINGFPVFKEIHVWRIDCFSKALLLAARAVRAYEAFTGPDPLHHRSADGSLLRPAARVPPPPG